MLDRLMPSAAAASLTEGAAWRAGSRVRCLSVSDGRPRVGGDRRADAGAGDERGRSRRLKTGPGRCRLAEPPRRVSMRASRCEGLLLRGLALHRLRVAREHVGDRVDERVRGDRLGEVLHRPLDPAPHLVVVAARGR